MVQDQQSRRRPLTPRARSVLTVWLGCALLGLATLVSSGTVSASGASGNSGKLDAPLRAFVHDPAKALAVYADRVRVPAGLQKRVETGRLQVLIRLESSDPSTANSVQLELEKLGVTVGSRLGKVLSAEVPIIAIGDVAKRDGLASIELTRRQVPRLHVSMPATGAATLRTGAAPAWTGLTGKGVIVGIIDDGLDFRHRDFRSTDGSTRLLALWDQRASGTSGQVPTGYSYGGECTPTLLNAAIGGDAAACKQPSGGAHGTHVAGIAAGNGAGTGSEQPAYRFIGMAPEADILAANSIGDGVDAANAVVDAIAWMKGKAAALGKPLVINMSLGSYYGSRDGSSNFEQALSGAGAAGVILIAAAGNEGDAPIRGEGTLAQDGTLVYELSVPEGSSNRQFEVWYPGGNAYTVAALGPDCEVVGPVLASNPLASTETPCGLVAVSNGGPFANNDDRQLLVTLRTGNSPLKAGTWRITLAGTQVAGGTTSVSAITGETAGGMTIVSVNGQALPAVTGQILTDTSSASRVIGVAAYNTNYSWNSVNGPSSGAPQNGPVGDLAGFSSRGPRRMCSNAAKCPQVMKPEITAPGSMIMAASASDTPTASVRDSDLELDRVHIVKAGTSMAAPHVAGAVALLLQQRPTLTPEEVRQLLFANIQKTPLTPALPNYTGEPVPPEPNHAWGYGVLDIAKAVAALPAESPAAVLTAFEFWYQPENRYFLTIDPGEAAAIDAGSAGAGWQRTGLSFKAYSAAGSVAAGVLPVCRFYGSVSPGPNSHFFTANAGECQFLRELQTRTPPTEPRWNYEGIGFRTNVPADGACASGLLPVMRAYNGGASRGLSSNHRFSTSETEMQRMASQGWTREGIAFCSPL